MIAEKKLSFIAGVHVVHLLHMYYKSSSSLGSRNVCRTSQMRNQALATYQLHICFFNRVETMKVSSIL